jgi:hypothetical protein
VPYQNLLGSLESTVNKHESKKATPVFDPSQAPRRTRVYNVALNQGTSNVSVPSGGKQTA